MMFGNNHHSEEEPELIGGKPIDFHYMKDYLLNISPYQIKTAMRLHNIRGIEEIRRYTKPADKLSGIWKIILIIIIAIGIGIFIIFFLPGMLQGMQGFLGQQAKTTTGG